MSRLVAWYDAHRGSRAIVFVWLATRLLILLVLAAFERFVVGDVFYYHRKINALFTAGLDRTLFEYPTPVVWILWLPYGASFGSRVGYLIAFVVFMLALDALFTYALWRSTGRRHDTSIDFWLIFVPLIGPLAYLRFDMLPAVLAGGALLAARRKPWVTGALTGLGAAIKLWPALLIGAFMSYRSDRRPAGVAFVVVGFGLALDQPDLRWLVTTHLATDLAVRSRAADRVDLGNAVDAGTGSQAGSVDRRHLPVPGVRDLRSGRRCLGDDQQHRDATGSGTDHSAYDPCLPP